MCLFKGPESVPDTWWLFKLPSNYMFPYIMLLCVGISLLVAKLTVAFIVSSAMSSDRQGSTGYFKNE